MASIGRRIRSTALVTALSVVATGAGLPPAAAQSPSAPAAAVVVPDLTLPAAASRAADAALVVADAPGELAGSLDADAAIDEAFATADALGDTTWEVPALAETLGQDPEAAFRLVRDRIRFEPYPGVLRGAQGTLAARAGNAFDRALLLRALLDAMDIPARFAFGELDEASARALVARTLGPIADPLPEAGDLAATTIDLEALATRARRDHARLLLALEGADVTVGRAPAEDPVAETRRHAWVQVDQDGTWVDLDPSMPDAEPGRALTTASSFAEVMPEDAFQSVTLQVSVEHLVDASLETQEVLQRRLTAPEAAGAEVFLYFVPDGGGGGLLGGPSTGMFVPQLMVDREAQAGTAFSVAAEGGEGDFFGLGGGGGPALTGAWLTIVREAPGREPVATAVELLDRVPGGIDRGSVSAGDLEPLAATDVGPAALSGVHHVLVSNGGADPREAAIARGAALAFATTDLLDEAAAAELPLGDLLWPVAVADEQLALASERLLVPALADAGVVAPVIDRPRVSVLSLGPDVDDPSRVETSIDLAADEIRLVADEKVDPQALAQRRIWYGALQSALETETLLRSAAWGIPAGMALTGASLSMDQPLSVLTDPAALPAGAAPSLAGALESGLVAIVPGDPATATTWWTVDPTDGSTRAIVSPGLGGAVASRPHRRATHDVQGSWTPGGGGYVNSAQSGVRYVINPNTLETEGVIRNGQYYRYTRGAPSARTCTGGNDYSTLLGCVSIPMALVIGTVTVVITMWALSRVIRALR